MNLKSLATLAMLGLLAACSSDDAATTNTPTDGTGGYGAGGTSSDLDGMNDGSPTGIVKIGDRVFFEFNSDSITDEGQQTLRRQAEWLTKYSTYNVTVEGHCDERGTREFNLALGERRANAAKNFLISLGVSASRVSTISYGKEHPEVMGSDEASWSKNRRAVTVVN